MLLLFFFFIIFYWCFNPFRCCLASGLLNFNYVKLLLHVLHITWNSFDWSTLPFLPLSPKKKEILWGFFNAFWAQAIILGKVVQRTPGVLRKKLIVDLDSRSKVKFQDQTGNQVDLGSYLKTYWTQRLHTWYQNQRSSRSRSNFPKTGKKLKNWPYLRGYFTYRFHIGTKVQPNKVHSMTQVPMILTQSQGQRSRSNFPKNT